MPWGKGNKGIHLITVPMEPDGVDLLQMEATIKKYAPKFKRSRLRA